MYRFLCGQMFSAPLGKYQGVWLLDFILSKFSFVRNNHTVFQSICTILHSHQQWMRVPVPPHPCQHLVLSVSWILAILISMWWYFIVLIRSSLITYDVEYLFICLPSVYLFGEVSVKIFGPFFNRVTCFLTVAFYEFIVYFG